MSKTTSLASLLRELRESRGISARRIEQLGGPSRKVLREYESGERVPTEPTVYRLLATLGVPEMDPRAAKIVALTRSSRDLPVLRGELSAPKYDALVDAMTNLVLKLDGRPITKVLELNARNEVLAVMRRVIGGQDGGSDAQE